MGVSRSLAELHSDMHRTQLFLMESEGTSGRTASVVPLLFLGPRLLAGAGSDRFLVGIGRAALYRSVLLYVIIRFITWGVWKGGTIGYSTKREQGGTRAGEARGPR
jgi:hypothetical protein